MRDYQWRGLLNPIDIKNSYYKKNLLSLKCTNSYRQTKTVQFLQHSPFSLTVISNLSIKGFTNLSICQGWTERHNPDVTLNLWRDVSHTRTDHFHNGLKHKRRKTVKRATVFRFCLGTKHKSSGIIQSHSFLRTSNRLTCMFVRAKVSFSSMLVGAEQDNG